MYEFVCSNGHKSYSASKQQTDPCPTCNAPVQLVGTASPKAQS